MSEHSFRIIIAANDPALEGIAPLFERMYEEVAAQGLMLTLAPGGATIWLKGVMGGLERFGRLVVAEVDGEVVGFAHAGFKLAPEHLGGGRIGHVSHLYVDPRYRRSGIARSLAASLHEWLTEKQVISTELQVVQGNEAAHRFWRSLGYAVELVQMRRS
jgi:ribosomal protein S18 acetylase RimI-like enzyme